MTITRRKSLEGAYVSRTEKNFLVDNKTGKEKMGLISEYQNTNEAIWKINTVERTFLVFSSSVDIFLANDGKSILFTPFRQSITFNGQQSTAWIWFRQVLFELFSNRYHYAR